MSEAPHDAAAHEQEHASTHSNARDEQVGPHTPAQHCSSRPQTQVKHGSRKHGPVTFPPALQKSGGHPSPFQSQSTTQATSCPSPSLGSQTSSPQTTHVPQSLEQFVQVSVPLHTESPQLPTHSPQSLGQDSHVSLASQTAFEHTPAPPSPLVVAPPPPVACAPPSPLVEAVVDEAELAEDAGSPEPDADVALRPPSPALVAPPSPELVPSPVGAPRRASSSRPSAHPTVRSASTPARARAPTTPERWRL